MRDALIALLYMVALLLYVPVFIVVCLVLIGVTHTGKYAERGAHAMCDFGDRVAARLRQRADNIREKQHAG